MTTKEPIEWRFELACAVYLADLAIVCALSLLELGSSEKFEINSFLQIVRTKMNDIHEHLQTCST